VHKQAELINVSDPLIARRNDFCLNRYLIC